MAKKKTTRTNESVKPEAAMQVEQIAAEAPATAAAENAAASGTDDEPAQAAPAESKAPAKKRGKRVAAVKGDASTTLADVFAGYVANMESEGKSLGTVASYEMELALAGHALGLDTPIGSITPEIVLAFFVSDPVVRTRSGRDKSPLSIAKTTRVVRQALMFAETKGLVAKAPLPEQAATY